MQFIAAYAQEEITMDYTIRPSASLSSKHHPSGKWN